MVGGRVTKLANGLENSILKLEIGCSFYDNIFVFKKCLLPKDVIEIKTGQIGTTCVH